MLGVVFLFFSTPGFDFRVSIALGALPGLLFFVKMVRPVARDAIVGLLFLFLAVSLTLCVLAFMNPKNESLATSPYWVLFKIALLVLGPYLLLDFGSRFLSKRAAQNLRG